MESARRRLRKIAEISNAPDDPPDEEWMRAIDELRPHRPVFKGSYQAMRELVLLDSGPLGQACRRPGIA
jgi:hypothetical protein